MGGLAPWEESICLVANRTEIVHSFDTLHVTIGLEHRKATPYNSEQNRIQLMLFLPILIVR